jgi:hypothetical protein
MHHVQQIFIKSFCNLVIHMNKIYFFNEPNLHQSIHK